MRKSKLSKDVRGYIKKLASKPESEDECPCCHSKNCFDYPEGGEILDDNVVYKWDCEKCGASGYEGCSIKFEEHTIEDEGKSQEILIARAKRAMARKKRSHAIASAKT